MARLKDREKALALRKKEMSYSQIKKILGISKSTLSYWLQDCPLSEERIKHLQRLNGKRSEQAIERYRNTMRRKKEKRLKDTYNIQKKEIFPLSDRELFLAGVMLYWGEGTKCRMNTLEMTNSDPAVINFFIKWANKSLSVPKKKARVQLHLYNDMDIDKEINYWSNIIKIPRDQFTKPYIKKTSSERINHKGGFGHGTCQARMGSTPLAEKVFMSMKVIGDRY